MRSVVEIRAVLWLVAAGLNDGQIARVTGVPRSTVRDWRSGRNRASHRTRPASKSCSHCGAAEHDFDALPPEYVYLLGMYLGDGHIVVGRKGVYRLTVAMDAQYRQMISECAQAIRAVVPGAAPYYQRKKTAAAFGSSSGRSSGLVYSLSTAREESTSGRSS
jgi:Homeodomain-like domain